ncbi:MAG: SDR family oxidoreductase [Chloroflexi bacterium]|nr:SDR family oxidoreductase [Chloroflexota bacterium]
MINRNIFRDDVLKDRVAIVTGGGTGIGRGIALELAKVGAKLVIASRRLEHLEPTAEEIRALGAQCLVVQLDVRDRESVENLVERTIAEYGAIDLLVNNAAGNFRVAAEDLSPNGWRSVLGIDLDGTFNCTQAVGRRWIQQNRGGAIVNIIFRGAWMANPYGVHASAAKAGVLAMTRTLAVEWAKYGIRVNAISPGPFADTPGLTNVSGVATPDVPRFERPYPQVPLGRMGEIEEIGWTTIFLASDAAGYITGEVISVDGGSHQSDGGRRTAPGPRE